MGMLEMMFGPTLPRVREEQGFRGWYVPMAKKLGIDQNPDSPEHHYDNRAFYRAMLRGEATSPDKPGGHFPSTFKTEGHPRTYLDDGMGRVFDTRSAAYVDDGSPVPMDRLRASEQSPDMPGYRPPPPRLVPPGMALPFQDITRGPTPQTPSFRDPMQAGPSPPAGGPLAAMFPRRKRR